MQTANQIKEKLGHYKKLKKDCELLEHQLYNAGNQLDMVADSVGDYRRGYKRIIGISGYGDRRVPSLSERLSKNIEEMNEIETFISSVEDITLRNILTRRYILGQSVEEAAKAIGYGKRYVLKILSRYFESGH